MASDRRITIHCIGNAHIDPVWRWTWQEGYAETLSTCQSALDRLNETDDFIFSRGQAATYAWIEESNPEMFAEIRKYVKAGRWHIVNGWWEQPDCNIPCGESYVRHALYGKRWFRDKLGVDVLTGWNPDTFGHNAGLPQILSKSGFTAYIFFRPGAHEKDLPGPYFWWEGPDGSRIFTIRPPVGHYTAWQPDLSELAQKCVTRAEELGLEHGILFYGVGNHGGGPTKENIASIQSMGANPEMPNTIFSTVEAFRQAVADKSADFPVVADDLQHHAPGCYTTHSEIKRLNRKAEYALMGAEKWCAAASAALGRPYPHAEFQRAWKNVLFNQFHDILAGTSVAAAYDDSRDEIGEALAIAAHAENAALQAFAAQIDTRVDETIPPQAGAGRPVLLFNDASWERTDPVSVQWGWRGNEDARLVDEAGNDVPYQYVQPDIFGGGSRMVFEPTVPAMGYRVYRVLKGAAETQENAEKPGSGPNWIQNRHYRLEFDPQTGELAQLIDRANGVTAVGPGGCGLLVMNDPGDTWGHDIASWRDLAGKFGEATFRVIEEGPVCVVAAIDTRWGSSTARQEFTLYRDSRRIDVTLTLNWHEKYKFLKLAVPTTVSDGALTYDVPYSTIVRASNGHEDPGQNWIDLTGPRAEGSQYGVSLLNDSKFGFDCLDGEIRMSLLRSPIYCFHDPAKPQEGRDYKFMDQGIHVIKYALLPHTGSWQEAGTQREAFALNRPLRFQYQYAHEGALGPVGSLLEVTPAHVTAATVKRAEDGDALIVRLFENEGQEADATVTLRGLPAIEVKVRPWELKTLRVERDGTWQEVNLLEE
jgi:alpha-mannosidase